MTALTRDRIEASLGRLSDIEVSEILAVAATEEEFHQALAWLANDEAPMNEGEPLPSGRVGRLIELMEELDEELAVDEVG